MFGRRARRIALVAVIAVVVVLAASALLLVNYGNRIIKGELERRLGKVFSIEQVDLKWGSVEARGIKLRNAEGKDMARIESLSARADFMQFLRKEYVISSLTIKGPYVFVEVDHNGTLVSPVLPLEEKMGPALERELAAANVPVPLTITHLRIEKGEVDFRDGKSVRTPVLTRLKDIDLDVKDVTLPLSEGFTKYELSARIVGNMSTGSIKSNGKIRPKTKDVECKGEVRRLDITNFKPYFRKDTNVDITKGFLDVDVNVKVASGKLHAPGKAVLKDLEFSSLPGAKNRFMGVPLSLVVAFLKRNNNEIPINFSLEGEIDNPRMNIRENFVNDLTQGLAGKLGLSLGGIGQSMVDVGSAGVKGVGSGVKSIGKGFKRIFGK